MGPGDGGQHQIQGERCRVVPPGWGSVYLSAVALASSFSVSSLATSSSRFRRSSPSCRPSWPVKGNADSVPQASGQSDHRTTSLHDAGADGSVLPNPSFILALTVRGREAGLHHLERGAASGLGHDRADLQEQAHDFQGGRDRGVVQWRQARAGQTWRVGGWGWGLEVGVRE